MDYQAHIVRDPRICGGEPVVCGTRVTIRASLAENAIVEEIVADFPSLSPDAVRAVIGFTASSAWQKLRRTVLDLKPSAPLLRCPRHVGDDRLFVVLKRHTQNHRRSRLGRETKVDHPDFATHHSPSHCLPAAAPSSTSSWANVFSEAWIIAR
ncbi:MAG: DUF433 domain-containing protein [Verrucomicrobia bacterium]|nr:DUF433 domain-containing protein [Verrucomicrobiota bacterium]